MFDWPEGGQIRVTGLGGVTGACLLGDTAGQPLAVRYEGDVLVVAGPAEAPDAIDTVVVLTVEP